MQVEIDDRCAQSIFSDAGYVIHFVLNPDLQIVNVSVLIIGVLTAIFHHAGKISNLLVFLDHESVNGLLFGELYFVLWVWLGNFNRIDRFCKFLNQNSIRWNVVKVFELAH